MKTLQSQEDAGTEAWVNTEHCQFSISQASCSITSTEATKKLSETQEWLDRQSILHQRSLLITIHNHNQTPNSSPSKKKALHQEMRRKIWLLIAEILVEKVRFNASQRPHVLICE